MAHFLHQLPKYLRVDHLFLQQQVAQCLDQGPVFPQHPRRPLPGSMPSVDTQAEARELVETQDTNPLINLDQMPFDGQPIDDSSFRKGNKDMTPA